MEHDSGLPHISRPDSNDRALPMSYGDLILLSCSLDNEKTAYLCEDGCVEKDTTERGMRTSSRELIFEVCTACDTRALLQMHEFLRRHGMPLGNKLTHMLSPHEEAHWKRLLYHRDMELHNNKTHAQHMVGRPVTFGDHIQLRQVKSNMFLGVDIGQAPKLEPAKKRVVLMPQPEAPLAFVILPRDKCLVEGHTVCFGDEASFVSTEFKDEYLHASKGFRVDPVIGFLHEVNLSSPADTAWKLECYFPHNMHSANHVKAGDVVRLHHPFLDAYISSNMLDDTVCLQQSDRSLSSTMWVVSEDDVLAGGLLRINRSYKFMQLVTRKYMVPTQDVLEPAMKLSWEASEGKTKMDSSCLFRAVEARQQETQAALIKLEPFDLDEREEHVKWGSRFHLAHGSSGRYLHCMPSNMLVLKETLRGATSPEATPRGGEHGRYPNDDSWKLGGLLQDDDEDLEAKWREVPERVIVASPAFFREDCFDIVKVSEEQVHAVDTLITILPPVKAYQAWLLKALQEDDPQFPEDKVLEVTASLTDMEAYAYTAQKASYASQAWSETYDMQPIAYCQNFLKDLLVPELLTGVLRNSLNMLRKQYFYKYQDSMLRPQEMEVPATLSRVPSAAQLVKMSSSVSLSEAQNLAAQTWRDVTLADLLRPESNVLGDVRNRSAKLVCEMCYRVLVCIVHKHAANANYLAKYIDEFQEQIMTGLGAGRLLLEILGDNALQLSNVRALKEEHLHFHINAIRAHGKDPMHLSFLSSMVAECDEGIEAHQDIVLPYLMQPDNKILLKVRRHNQAIELFDPQSLLVKEWIDLGQLVTGSEGGGEKGSALRAMLEYWIESLKLLTTLCKPGKDGRRDFVVKKVQTLIGLDVAISCLQDDGLPEDLRRNVCEYIRVAFVENDDQIDTTRSTGVVLWKDLAASEKFPSRRHEKGYVWGDGGATGGAEENKSNLLTDLKDTLRNYFGQNATQYHPGHTLHANELKLSVMRLCRQLTLLGYFDEAELQGVISDVRAVLDFSTLRIRTGANDSILALSKASPEFESVLSEQTISSALRHLRPLCNSFPPMEVSLLRDIFEMRIFNAGETIVEAGKPAGDMYVLQSGVAFMIEIHEGVESVVDTVAAGGMFGVNTLGSNKTVWQWRVRSSQKVTALHVSAKKFQDAVEKIARGSRLPLTDTLQVVLEIKRLGCIILNDIYDLRLAIRTAKLLQEYRFDLNISKRQYYNAQTSSNFMLNFPFQGDGAESQIATKFDFMILKLLPAFITRNLRPIKYCFLGMLRIDRGTFFIALCQYVFAIAVCTTVVQDAELVQDEKNDVFVDGSHPGPAHSPIALYINFAVTAAWSVMCLALAWASFMHNARLVYLCAYAQIIYGVFYIANTIAGLIVAIMDAASPGGEDADASTREKSSEIVAQVLWLIFILPLGLYNTVLILSLSTHLDHPAFFIVALREQQAKNDEADDAVVAPRREFIKILEYFDLDENGDLSNMLADLIISPHIPLVVDAFHLLVRSHRSQQEVHKALVNTLLLVDDTDKKLDAKRLVDEADALTLSLLNVANTMQAYVVERNEAISNTMSKTLSNTATQQQTGLEDRLRVVRTAEPLLLDLIAKIGDGQPGEQRKLFQKKGVDKIVIRLLRSLPADYLETCAPLCYTALSFLCYEALDIQNYFANNIMDILELHFETLPKHVEMLLTAMYRDNFDLCYKVEEKLIVRIVSRLKDDMDAHSLLFLKMIICPKDLVVRRNQNLIVKHLDSKDMPELPLCGRKSGRALRKMYDFNTPQGKEFLACYVAAIELVTASMANGNHENKLRCRGGSLRMTLTLKDIAEDLYDRHIPNRVKIALLRYLDEAYIRVVHDEKQHILRQDMLDVLDHYARRLELLQVNRKGSKVAFLKGTERVLIIESYVQVCLSYFKHVPKYEIFRPDTGRLNVTIRLCESLLRFVLEGRKDLHPKDELRLLQVLEIIWERFDKKDPRFAKETDPFGPQRGSLVSEDEDDVPEEGLARDMLKALGEEGDRGLYARQVKLRAKLHQEDELKLNTALDVPDGVPAFADEFLQLTGAYRDQQTESLLNAFQERVVATQGKPSFSHQHMQSLVELLSSPSLSQELRHTGLSILMHVVRMMEFPSSELPEDENPLAWLQTSVPEMVVKLISVSDSFGTSDDAVVSECLCVAIQLLEMGKKAAQDSFYAIFTRDEHVKLFEKVRERLVRAERGLPTFVATFHNIGEEMMDECANHGHVLTIQGVKDITVQDRLCIPFVGAHAAAILRFLQLLCEGHNRDMQQYMRRQGKTSTDLVTCTSDFLSVCARHICPATMGLVIQCVDTLIEFVQNPCYDNQKGLVDTQLPHVVHHFLQMTSEHHLPFDDHDTYVESVSELKTKSVTLLLSLLERVEDPFVPSRILKALEIDKLIDSMNALRKGHQGYPGYLDEDADSDEEDDGIASQELSDNASFQVACSLFMLYKMLSYYDTTDELIRKCNRHYIKDIARLRANCGFVEISRDGRLERVFFQIPSVCRFLTESAKASILREVNRENHQDQMLDLVSRGQVRYEEMCHLQLLNQSLTYKTFRPFSQHVDRMFFLNALIINIIMLFSFQYKDKEYMTLQDMNNIIIDDAVEQALVILTALQLVMSLVRMSSYYVDTGVLRVNRIFKSNEEYSRVADELFGGPRYYFLFYKILFTDGYFILLIIFAGCNVTALALYKTSSLFFFLMSFHLVDMFNSSQSLQNVTVAVKSRANTLLQTTGLAFIMMYIYGAIGFVFFAEKFEFEEAEIQDGYRQVYNVNSARCDTIWKCFLVTVDMGLRKGDIGGAIDDIQWRDLLPGTYFKVCESVPGLEYLGCLGVGGDDVSPFIFLRIAYTSTFFILINTILVNIVFGAIIDTYGDLREQREEMEEELQVRCFICGLERFRLETNSADGNGFERHIREDHNIWVYVYFIVHLLRKEVSEHTGFESYVFSKLNDLDEKGEIRPKVAPDVTWFPCNEAMVLKVPDDAKLEVQLSRRLAALEKTTSEFGSKCMTSLQAVMAAIETRGDNAKHSDSNSDESDDHSSDDGQASANQAGSTQPEAINPVADLAQAVTGGLFEATSGLLTRAEGIVGGPLPSLGWSNVLASLPNRGAQRTLAEEQEDASPRTRYRAALQRLAEDGYDNEDMNLHLLELHAGNVEVVRRVLAEEDTHPPA